MNQQDNKAVVDKLHDLLVSPKNPTKYQSKTIDYQGELWGDIMDNYADYFQTWWTVCGAQDPAVILLNEEFGKIYPSLAKYSTVRVIDRFLNSWSSETLLEFSNEDMTDTEYEEYEKLMKEEENE